MARLWFDGAPAAGLPLRFLFAMPAWGIVGGLLLLADAGAPLQARWHSATLALVHVWVLGVLGNAMFGSLLQFLPVAVGARVRGLCTGPWLHAGFNLGVLLLIVGLHGGVRWALAAAGVLLPASFVWLAAMLLPGLAAVAGERLLRAGIGAALGYGVVAALLGGALAWWLPRGVAALPALADIHAGIGVLGWIVLLLAAVGRVTMPMFQGTGTVPVRAQACWLAAVALALPVAALSRWWSLEGAALSMAVAAGGASFALAGLWLQLRAPRARRNALHLQWRIGLTALLAAAFALFVGRGMLAGALALVVGLPLLVGAMAMEIVPFVGWIRLRHRVRRGIQVPGVRRLLPDRGKRRVLLAQCVAAALLVAAVLFPAPWLARIAGAAQVVAWTLHGAALASVLRTGAAFVRQAARVG